ncbi:MAG: hypothetical protein BWY86_01327 [Candidatus Aminicenantes bacterium ADurb.Bin508]|nr:MAG: hypothetical protein BWY86_01327 [Candidatus Aminicenantes bacterium ADurb.Bin508]
MRLILTFSAFKAMERSSAREMIWAIFTPFSGRYSKVEITGPGWYSTTLPSMLNSRSFSSMMVFLTFSS